MKKLFLLLLILASKSWATFLNCYPGTDARFFDNQANVNDQCVNAYNLTTVGSLVFNTSPAPPKGTYEIGTFSDSNYCTAPSGLVTDMLAARNAFTIQYYFYLNSFTTDHVVVSDANLDIFGFKGSGTKLRWLPSSGAGELLGATTISTATWYHVTFSWDGTWRRIYLSSAATGWVDVLDGISSGNGAISASITLFWIGRWQGGTGFSLPGYINMLRFSNVVVPPPYPTLDTRKIINGASATASGGVQ